MPDSARDGKYGWITTERGDFYPDEPVFLLRAKDRNAAEAVDAYAAICENDGCSPEHIAAIERHRDRIRAWQAAHSDLVKRPD